MTGINILFNLSSFLDDSFRKNLESALRFGNPLLVQVSHKFSLQLYEICIWHGLKHGIEFIELKECQIKSPPIHSFDLG